MKKEILVTLLSGALTSLSVQAAWTVVSTFDDETALSAVTDITNIEGSNARSGVVNGMWAVFPGDLFEQTSNIYALLDLGVDMKAAGVASGQPVTLYFEILQPMVDDGLGGMRKALVDTSWGPYNWDAAEVLNQRFNGFNAMQRINSGNDSFEGRNGTAYEPFQPFNADVRYKLWMVIDYTLNFSEFYVQGGQWTEQTRLDTIDTTGIWLFRQNPAPETIVRYFHVALSAGTIAAPKGRDPTMFDNFAVDLAGQNLTTPDVGGGFGNWGPWPIVDAAGNVDTTPWLGWVNVAAKPYIWSYTLNTYMYIDEGSITSGGSWVYVYN
jgi:hypothetical protein